jgi:putative hemolysin
MREILDTLIEERAPWLRRRGPLVTLARPLLHRVLWYERTVKIGEALEPMPAADVMQSLAEMIALHLEVAGRDNIPRQGPALVVANHPTGIADAMMARRFNLPVIPLHITARNSALFYLFDRIHPTLRDITLFHEVLNKTRQRYRLNLGPAIDPETLPSGSTEAIEVLRARTLELGGRKPQTVLTAPIYGRPRGLKPARLTV